MFETAPYVSLRTYRKTGVAVDTPVWVAGHADHLYVFSAGNAGKVKRLRIGNKIGLAVCDARGGSVGEWRAGSAELIDDATEIAAAQRAFRQKYGWQMFLADWGAKLTGRFNKRAYIRISI